jgi:hypothetical protein
VAELAARHMPCPYTAVLDVRRLDMMWVLLAVIAGMGFALVKVRRQRKIREARGSQAQAA